MNTVALCAAVLPLPGAPVPGRLVSTVRIPKPTLIARPRLARRSKLILSCFEPGRFKEEPEVEQEYYAMRGHPPPPEWHQQSAVDESTQTPSTSKCPPGRFDEEPCMPEHPYDPRPRERGHGVDPHHHPDSHHHQQAAATVQHPDNTLEALQVEVQKLLHTITESESDTEHDDATAEAQPNPKGPRVCT
eukprot:jgi/Chrzof1/12249/Cz06g27050.t1